MKTDSPIDIDDLLSERQRATRGLREAQREWTEARDELLAIQRDACLLATVLAVLAEAHDDPPSSAIAKVTIGKLRSSALRAFLEGSKVARILWAPKGGAQ